MAGDRVLPRTASTKFIILSCLLALCQDISAAFIILSPSYTDFVDPDLIKNKAAGPRAASSAKTLICGAWDRPVRMGSGPQVARKQQGPEQDRWQDRIRSI